MKNNNFCPLCDGLSTKYYDSTNQLFHRCNSCFGIFIDEHLRPNKKAERARYIKHINDVEDKGYQDFVSPITNAILNDFTKHEQGLDFGAGTGPVISKILTDNHFNIKLYDPFFHNNRSLLLEKYDYIACCEVIEHFHTPKAEFKLLKELLVPKGKMYCMTNIYNETIDFHTWEYRSDPTHVFFYHTKTINWIKEKFGYSNVIMNDRLITFSN